MIAGHNSPVRWLTDSQYSRLPVEHRSVAWADSQVGVQESPINVGPRVEEYQEVAGLGRGGGFAWCACFVYWCLIRAGVRSGRLPERGKCAAVRNWISWAESTGRVVKSPSRGTLFYWLDNNQRGHIGYCLGPAIFGIFRTIEGNTDSGAGSRDGDGVYKRFRTVAELRRFPQWGFISLRNL